MMVIVPFVVPRVASPFTCVLFQFARLVKFFLPLADRTRVERNTAR